MKVGDVVLGYGGLVHIVSYVDRGYPEAEMELACRPNYFWLASDEQKTWDPPSCLFCISGRGRSS